MVHRKSRALNHVRSPPNSNNSGVIMRATVALGLAVALVLGLNVIVRSEGRPDPREELATAIPEAIRLLKDKKYADLLRTFAHPKLLEAKTGSQSLESLAEEFAQTRAARALAVLQQIEGKKPELSEDGKTATFVHDGEGIPSPIIFKKIGDYWYIDPGDVSGTESSPDLEVVQQKLEAGLEGQPIAAPQIYTPEQVAAIRTRLEKSRADWEKAVPPGSWERENNTIVLDTGRTKLFCKEFQVLPNGRVKLEHCTLVVLLGNECLAPDAPWYLSDVPPGRLIVYRMPEGVVLESEELHFQLKNHPSSKKAAVPELDRR